jgi:hypothetical protein
MGGPRLRSRQARRFASPRCARLAGLTRPHPRTLGCHAVDAQRRPRSRSSPLPGVFGTRAASGSRALYADGSYCTRRRSNAHRTANLEEREVLYPWHPWGGCIVRVHEAIEKADGIVLRCSRDGATKRRLELPAWMFDRAVCLPMRITRDPRIEFAALAALRELLTGVASRHDQSSSSNTPVSSTASEARDKNRGNTHATPKSTSGDQSPASPSARPIRFAGSRRLRSAGPAVGSAAGRDTPVGDRADGTAPARSRPCRSPSGSDGGSR